MATDRPDSFPKQHQTHQPGREHEMEPQPAATNPAYRGSGKLQDKVALITGGDSGIGRAVAVLFAREGADVAIVYLEEDQDAQTTKRPRALFSLLPGPSRRTSSNAASGSMR